MRSLLLGAALALVSLSGCAKDKEHAAATATDNLPTMTVDEVEAAVNAKQAQAVDCNGERTRKKRGVVPGAILISDEELYPASELPADKTTKLVFYCADPGWHASHTGAGRAISFGYKNVFVMPDGIMGWVKAGKQVQQI